MKPSLITTIYIALVAIITEYIWSHNMLACRFPEENLSDFGIVAYQMFTDLNKYLISLATLLLGGLGALGMTIQSLSKEDERVNSINLLCIAAVLGITSLYFAFVSHVGIAEAAINGCAVFGPMLEVSQRLQFGTLVAGLITTLYLMFRFLGYKRRAN